MKIKVKKLNDRAVLPVYGSQYAAGADLYACTCEELTIAPHATVMVPTAVAQSTWLHNNNQSVWIIDF